MHRLPQQPHLIVVDDLALLQCSPLSLAHVFLGLLERARVHASSVHQWQSPVNKDGSGAIRVRVPILVVVVVGSSSGSVADKTCRVVVADSFLPGLQHVKEENTLHSFVRSTWRVSPLLQNQRGEHGETRHLLKYQVSLQRRCEQTTSCDPTFQMGVMQRRGVTMLVTSKCKSPENK